MEKMKLSGKFMMENKNIEFPCEKCVVLAICATSLQTYIDNRDFDDPAYCFDLTDFHDNNINFDIEIYVALFIDQLIKFLIRRCSIINEYLPCMFVSTEAPVMEGAFPPDEKVFHISEEEWFLRRNIIIQFYNSLLRTTITYKKEILFKRINDLPY